MRVQPRVAQAAESVRQMIAAGALPPGAPAPSVAALRELTGVSRTYCALALRLLKEDGTLAAAGRRRTVPGPAQSSA